MATQFRVSRSSVREAIRELVALNILVTRRGAGTYVTDLSAAELFAPLHFALRVDPTSLLHLFELRRVLEPVAAAVAATRLGDDAVAELEALVANVKRRFTGGDQDLGGLVQADERLHERIIDTMHNPLISAIWNVLADAQVTRGAHQEPGIDSIHAARRQHVDRFGHRRLGRLVKRRAARDHGHQLVGLHERSR
ncbi:MAG: FadR family transcriptional regulator [Chloroflexi bacterium]|nr:MAG: FadR family transcriptional regulator [Chloroflexota bacterium]